MEGLHIFKYHSLFCSECFTVTLAPISLKYCFVIYIVWTVGIFYFVFFIKKLQPYDDQIRMIWEGAVSYSSLLSFT